MAAAVSLLLIPNVNYGQAPDLGTTSTFALFTAVGAFNNIGESTTVTGDVGTNVGAFNAFPPGILVGQKHVVNSASAQAATDVDVAYSQISSVTCGTVIGTTLGSGQVLTPDVYCLGAASTLNGDLILDGEGDASSLFIFKIDGALSTTVNSRVILKNGASICNVYWQVNGQVNLGNNSLFRGTILANGAIHLLEGATLLGRGLSREGAISLHNNIVTLQGQTKAATITASGPTALCPGGSVTLSGNNGGMWSTGSTAPTITVNTAGDYFVTNTNGCGGKVTSNHIIVTVNPKLTCTFIGNGSICIGESNELCVPFSDTSTYMWSTGATTNCITITAAGKYSVTITSADGCVSTCSKTIVLTTTPSCDITGKSTICEGGSTSLCAPSGPGYTYLWSNGATSRCVSVSAAGKFTVTVTKDNQKSSICSKTVTVSDAPICDIEGSNTFCKGESTRLSVPSVAKSTYLWSTGAKTNSITVREEGEYSVTVTTADGCKKTCKRIVKVTLPPTCIIEGSNTLSQGQSIQLCTPYGNGYTYLWSNGATTRCITVSTAGTYSVKVKKEGCTSTSTCSKTVTMSNNPVCVISGSSTLCDEGQSTQLCAPSGKGYKYLWSNGATTRCIMVTGPGTYSVTVNNNGYSSTCSKSVTVAPLACSITGSSTICEGTSTSLCGPSGTGYKYLWSNGATSRCIAVASGGTYTLKLTKDECTSTCSKTVSLSTPSCTINGTSTIGGNSTICEGESAQLCAPYGYGYTYLWSTGETSRCISVTTAGTVSLDVTKNGCTNTCSRAVIVNPNPVCSITGNFYPMKGQPTTLCAASGMTSYKWSTGETTRCITVYCSGAYTVVSELNGCVSSCSADVTSSCSSHFTSSSTSRTGGKAELDIKVNAYPNPFYSTAIIEIQNTELNSHILVELYNTKEHKISTLFDSDVKAGGLYKVELNAASLPPGIYIYRITNGYQVINRKLLLKR